jgi:ATP-dependent HslUV protease, peptidase subunit HslV
VRPARPRRSRRNSWIDSTLLPQSTGPDTIPALFFCVEPTRRHGWRQRFAAMRYNGRMENRRESALMHGTTVLLVRKDNKAVLIADGQVTMGDHVMKHTARKTRRLYNDKVIAGFAGSTADAISLFERFEGKLQEHSGNLQKASVELAKEWRKDRALRHLEALLIVADNKATFLLSGNGDVIEPDDGLCAIGSGGSYALAAARAMLKHSKLGAKDLAMEAMRIASEICIYTNANFTVEEL